MQRILLHCHGGQRPDRAADSDAPAALSEARRSLSGHLGRPGLGLRLVRVVTGHGGGSGPQPRPETQRAAPPLGAALVPRLLVRCQWLGPRPGAARRASVPACRESAAGPTGRRPGRRRAAPRGPVPGAPAVQCDPIARSGVAGACRQARARNRTHRRSFPGSEPPGPLAPCQAGGPGPRRPLVARCQ